MLEFSKHTNPIAKKKHQCSLCYGDIRAGEKYDRFCGLYDGAFFDLKHHLICSDIINEYCDYIGEDEYNNDNVIDWVSEIVCGDCIHNQDGLEDCNISNLFLCPKVIERFSKKQEQ